MNNQPITHTRQEDVVAALRERGYGIFPGFFSSADSEALAQECLARWNAGGFHSAGIGKGGEFQVRPDVRGDEVLWLDNDDATPAQRVWFDELEKLRLAINSGLYLGLFDYEGHFAVYRPGTFYKKHLDQFRGVEARTVTCVLYLNQRWREEDGGHLRFYTEGEREDVYIDVPPLAGTLACFLSGDFYHEVLPATRERLAVTGWFKTR